MPNQEKTVRLPKGKIAKYGLSGLALVTLWTVVVVPYLSKKSTDLIESQEAKAGDTIIKAIDFALGIPLGWIFFGVMVGLWLSTFFDTEMQPVEPTKSYSEETKKNIQEARKILGEMASKADVFSGSLNYSGQNCSLCGNAAKLQKTASTLPTEELRHIAASMQKVHKKMHKLKSAFVKLVLPEGVKLVEGGVVPNKDQVKMDGNIMFKAKKLYISSQENRLFNEIKKKQKKFWKLTEDFAE